MWVALRLLVARDRGSAALDIMPERLWASTTDCVLSTVLLYIPCHRYGLGFLRGIFHGSVIIGFKGVDRPSRRLA